MILNRIIRPKHNGFYPIEIGPLFSVLQVWRVCLICLVEAVGHRMDEIQFIMVIGTSSFGLAMSTLAH